ncbi:hypothetical protein MLD38_015803 [Melastoma candidum]|uniref:Uncharacterized protein n=1 Tax=Melastoma candidum TaxID=119954 RepID=A0ACB9RII6_9MYRT|nr:hypothetical protein MLD38_015803 [Melastoma candidum]
MAVAVFDFLFGWKKASKCKKLIRRVQCRLRLLRNKRESIVRQSRGDVARLVQMGLMEVASERAEQLLKDESVKEMYDLLDHFCEVIITNLSYIRRHRECPDDINEAVSSLIFASARCGDLPELRRIRELFRERYGERFTISAIDLLPGNLVNSKIRDHLSVKSVSDDSKSRPEDECAGDQIQGLQVQPKILAFEYASERHKQAEEMAERQEKCLDVVPISPKTIANLAKEDITATKTEKRATILVARSESQPRVMNYRCPEVRTSVWCSEEKERGTVLEKASEQREEKTATLASVESLPRHFPELKVVYLDDVEELQSLPKGNDEGLDQRLLEFKPSAVSASMTTEELAAERSVKQCKWSEDENVSSQDKVVPGKRLQWRSVSRQPKTIEDKEYATYNSAQNDNPRKILKQSPTEMRRPSLNPRPTYDNPCPAKITSVLHQSRRRYRLRSETEDHKIFYAVPNHARGFRGKLDVILDDSLDKADASTSSDSEEENGLLLPSYSRAMTMPPKRQTPRLDCNDSRRMPRSNSCPFRSQPNHVHPKLPDYDELASKFSALKEEYLLVARPPKPRINQHF